MAVKLELLGQGTFGGQPLFGRQPLFGGTNRKPSLLSILGPDRAGLYRTEEELARLQLEAEALGLTDTQGTGPKEFLSSVLDYSTRPGSAVLGFLTGLAGRTQPGEEQGALARYAAALEGKERYSGSQLVGKAPEGAGALERFGRAATGFGIDVITDPTNLLTFGTGGFLRGAGRLAATEAQVAREAAKVLKPIRTPEIPITKPLEAATATAIASERALDLATGIRTSPTPMVKLGETSFATKAPDIETALGTGTRKGATEVPVPEIQPITSGVDTTRDALTDKLAKAAAQGVALGGGTGARKAIERVLLDEGYALSEAEQITRKIISGTSGEVRGGTGLRLPFLGLDSKGRIVGASEAATRRVADITPGAGYLVDALGLRSMADAARDVFNTYRSKNFYAGWSKIMNGRFGAEYAAFIRKAHTGEGVMDYDTFTKLVANDNKRTAALAIRDRAASTAIQAADKMMKESDNPKAVKEAAERYYQMADDMVLEPNASATDIVGFNIANSLREYGDNMFRTELKEAAARAGVDIGDISAIARNYIPRPITLMEAKFRLARGRLTGKFNATKVRTIGYDTDQFGRLDTASSVELNGRFVDSGIRPAGHKVFETDPLKVAAQQFASYSELTSQLDLIADMKATGLLKERTAEQVRLLNLPNLARRGEKFEDTLTSVANRLANALQIAIGNNDLAQIDRIKNAISKVAADKVTINSMLSNIQDFNPESLKVIGNLTKVMRSSLAAGEKVGITLTKSEKSRLFSAAGLVRTKGTGGNVEELLAAGLKPIGLAADVKIPRGLSNLYADEAVKDAVEKYFKIESGGWRDMDWFNNVYMPYYTLFKTYVTVGRPGGYHLRNLQGAWWNNYLGDVSGSSHKQSASILNETRKAREEANAAIAAIRSGKPSGLTGDSDTLANYVVNLGRARGSDVVDVEVGQLADYILLTKLQKVKIGDYTAADILMSARDNNLMRGNKNLEYLRQEARTSGNELADALTNPDYVNLFKGKSKAELTKYQTVLNKAANFGVINSSGKVADLSENYVRLAAFIDGAKRYGLEDNGTAASYLTKALQFDYADLSDTERNVLKNIIPFYTWTRRNLPLQFSALINNPGKFNKLDYAKEELQSQFGAEGDDAYMNEMMPEWMREQMGFVTKFAGEAGPLAIAGPGFASPAFDLNRYLQVGPGSIDRVKKEAVSSANPLLKGVIESMTDIDLFTGGKFPEEGVASPFGELPIPGLTFVGADGKRRVDAQSYNIIKDVIPPLGLAARLLSPGEADRRLSSVLSTFGGVPVSTMTVNQVTSELRSREDRLRTKLDKTAGALGVDREWLRTLINEGKTADEIRQYIASGYGKL